MEMSFFMAVIQAGGLGEGRNDMVRRLPEEKQIPGHKQAWRRAHGPPSAVTSRW
jgi:hypothetical protein